MGWRGSWRKKLKRMNELYDWLIGMEDLLRRHLKLWVKMSFLHCNAYNVIPMWYPLLRSNEEWDVLMVYTSYYAFWQSFLFRVFYCILFGRVTLRCHYHHLFPLYGFSLLRFCLFIWFCFSSKVVCSTLFFTFRQPLPCVAC